MQWTHNPVQTLQLSIPSSKLVKHLQVGGPTLLSKPYPHIIQFVELPEQVAHGEIQGAHVIPSDFIKYPS